MIWGWQEQAVRSIQELSLAQRYITADDLHGRIEEPTNRNKVGPAFEEARRAGILQPTHVIVKSKRVISRKRNIQIWESRAFIAAKGPGPTTPDEIAAAYLAQSGETPLPQMSLDIQEPV